LNYKEFKAGNGVIKLTVKVATFAAFLKYRVVAIDEYFFTWATFCFPISVTSFILQVFGFTNEAGEWQLPLDRYT